MLSTTPNSPGNGSSMNSLHRILSPLLFTLIIVGTLLPSFGQDHVVPAEMLFADEEALPEKQPNELRVLSWNIHMLPRLIKRTRRGPLKRAKLIPERIIGDNVDVIIFQESFDVRVRRILNRRLEDTYPYRTRPANVSLWRLKTNSGIVVHSKFPIRHLEEIDFTQCEGDDCLARKGAMLVEIDFLGQPIQLLGTHLEAGGPWEIKLSQYSEIKALVDRHKKDGIPQFLCGDFNTHQKDEDKYNTMLEMLDVEDGPLLSSWKYTAGTGTDFKPKDPNKREVIDYILTRDNGFEAYTLNRYVRIYRSQWSEEYSSLSDHHAVLGCIFLDE